MDSSISNEAPLLVDPAVPATVNDAVSADPVPPTTASPQGGMGLEGMGEGGGKGAREPLSQLQLATVNVPSKGIQSPTVSGSSTPV